MYIVLDTETTDANPSDCGLIQLAVYNPVGDNFNMHCNPHVAIMPAATAIHGISNEAVQAYPEVAELKTAFDDYLRLVCTDSAPVVVAHNISFDVEVLQRHTGIVPTHKLCTFRMAKKLISRQVIGGFSVDAIFVYLFPDELEFLMATRQAHDALDDCILTDRIFTRMCEMIPDEAGISDKTDYKAIMDWVDKPMVLSTWPFGKHKGLPFDTDWGYCTWYMNQKERDPDIVHTITQLGQLRGKGGPSRRAARR